MDSGFDANRLATEKYGIGQPVTRKEDPILVRGEGCYTDDVSFPGQAYAVFVRSRIAHGTLNGIDVEEARGMPGVLAVLTYADLEAGGFATMSTAMPVPNRDGSAAQKPVRGALAIDRVRYVGEPVACVVAETVAQAKDAAEAVMPDIDSLPAVTVPSKAVAPGAPQLHDVVPGNVGIDFHFGDAEKVAAAFAAAAHTVKLSPRNNRIVVCPMEPRSAVARFDPAGERWTINVGCQGVFGLRAGLAGALKVPVEKVHVLTDKVGGSFGMKSQVYPEYISLFHAARALGRPVKWTDERSDSFLSDSHGRDHEMTGELAFDAQGNILAARLTGVGNLGAYPGAPLPPTINALKNLLGVYKTPLVEISTKAVYTNTTPVGAYRGAGRPEGNYYMERMMDTAAAEMGIDRVEIRRRNHIPASAMPYKAANDLTYDSGDFRGVLDDAVKLADWDGFAQRKAESKARGRLRGRGIGDYLEVTGPPSKEMGGIRFEKNGDVTIITGTLDYGQGHATPFAQVLSARLGVPFERIRLLQGDSDELAAGGGTGGSKSLMASGTAIVEASVKVIEQGKAIAGHVLEAAAVDIEFEAGRFAIAGTDRGIGIMELAEKLHAGLELPPELPRSLDVRHVSDGVTWTFPNGCHVAEVEVDPETGVVEVVRYTMVNDFGTVVNPMLVEGQAHGGIAQGIGQAFMERTVYDEDGQLLTGSYMDYCLPRASDMPPAFGHGSHPVPATTNPLGVKGCGEAGCAGSLPSVMNALVDALSELGIRHIDMPATPQHVWEAIREARTKAA